MSNVDFGESTPSALGVPTVVTLSLATKISSVDLDGTTEPMSTDIDGPSTITSASGNSVSKSAAALSPNMSGPIIVTRTVNGPAATTKASSSNPKGSRHSNVAIVVPVLTSLVGFAVGCALLVWFLRVRRRNKRKNASTEKLQLSHSTLETDPDWIAAEHFDTQTSRSELPETEIRPKEVKEKRTFPGAVELPVTRGRAELPATTKHANIQPKSSHPSKIGSFRHSRRQTVTDDLNVLQSSSTATANESCSSTTPFSNKMRKIIDPGTVAIPLLCSGIPLLSRTRISKQRL